MKNKIDLPILKDVIAQGKNIPKPQKPILLDETQAQALQQQIEKIIQTRLEVVSDKTMQEISKDIKKYLDNVLSKQL